MSVVEVAKANSTYLSVLSEQIDVGHMLHIKHGMIPGGSDYKPSSVPLCVFSDQPKIGHRFHIEDKNDQWCW